MKILSKKKNIYLLIILLIIGFASITTTFIIKGNTGIGVKEKDFDVYFSNVYLNDVKHNEFISADGKSINFETHKLINVGEQAILKYEIMNSSTQYDADIDLKFDPTTMSNEYVSIEMEKEYANDKIQASGKGMGSIIITLKKAIVEEDSLNFKVDMSSTATSIDSNEYPSGGINHEKPGDYSISSKLTDKDNNPVKNKPVVIISGNGIHYTETDLEGNIYADDLAEGTQEVFIFENKNLDEVKNMSEEEIRQNASEKITITTSTTGNATGENYKIKDIEPDKTEEIEVVSIKIGDTTLDKVLKDGDTIEFKVDSNATEVEIPGLGVQPIGPGENRFELVLEDGKTVTVIINNVRPTPPTIIGGTEDYTNAKKATITLQENGSALSDIAYYEYYIANEPLSDFTNITPMGTTDNEIEITEEGTHYIYYRTVSKNGTVSAWSEPTIVKLDYSSPVIDIKSTTTSSNKITIEYNVTDQYSGIRKNTCELGENNEFTKQGSYENGKCIFANLEDNVLYNYRICGSDNAGNAEVCKVGEARTKEIKNPLIAFDNNQSSYGEYYLGQTAKISFDRTGVDNPTYYIKSTRKGTSSINLTKSCGSESSPGECMDITPTTTLDKDVWYQVPSNLSISYTESSDEYSEIIALVYDGNNYSNKTTGTIGKIAYTAKDLEYTNALAPSVTNVQEAIDDLYKRLR